MIASKFGQGASVWSWLPLGFVLWFFSGAVRKPVRVSIASFEEGFTHYRGFPLLWESDRDYPGFAFDVYVIPLAANLLFFFLLAALLAKTWRRRSVLKQRLFDWCVGVPIYAFGCFVPSVVGIIFVVEPTAFHWWIDKSAWQDVEGFVLPIP